jgi:hypothetical protein
MMNLYKYYSNSDELLGANQKKYFPWVAYEQATKGKKLDARQLAAIASNPSYAYYYAIYVIKNRWPQGEAAIASSPAYAYSYARHVIKGRWPEGETAIASNPEYAYLYAKNIIRGRWPKGEAAITKGYAREYNDFLASLR